MTVIRTEALLLRAVDFGESDRIVHLLTPESGRLTAIAKGARRSKRRFPGTLDLFNRLLVQAERPRRPGMARLDHAALLEVYGALRSDPARFGLGCYLLELLERLAPEGAAPPDAKRLFAFAVAALRTLERVRPDARLRVLLEVRALDALGLRPELRRCVRCGRDATAAPNRAEPGPAGPSAPGVLPPARFHLGEGGPVCGACERPGEPLLPVSVGTLRALEGGLALDLGHLERLALGPRALEEARLLVRRFSRFHVGLELRSERFLDEILPG